MKKVTLTFNVPWTVEADLSEEQIATLFRDALYEFAHRGTKETPPRFCAESYVEKRYGTYRHVLLEEKLAEVRQRVEFATGITLAKVEKE